MFLPGGVRVARPTAFMTILDWAIIAGYLGFIVWLGARYARRQSNTTEYFLGGRQMPLPGFDASLVAVAARGIAAVRDLEGHHQGAASQVIEHSPPENAPGPHASLPLPRSW